MKKTWKRAPSNNKKHLHKIRWIVDQDNVRKWGIIICIHFYLQTALKVVATKNIDYMARKFGESRQWNLIINVDKSKYLRPVTDYTENREHIHKQWTSCVDRKACYWRYREISADKVIKRQMKFETKRFTCTSSD